MENSKFRYEKIIDHPHHVSKKRPKMSMRDRAAQFGSFKALNGYEEAVCEEARTVGERFSLDDDRRAELDRRIAWLCHKGAGEKIFVIYFVRDSKKEGGVYMETVGTFRRIDEAEGVLITFEGNRIPLDNIFEINGGNFYGEF